MKGLRLQISQIQQLLHNTFWICIRISNLLRSGMVICLKVAENVVVKNKNQKKKLAIQVQKR